MKHEKKSNDKIPIKDLCQTPAYALGPILPYLEGIIWECASGEGYLAGGLMNKGFTVIATDIANEGIDFLETRIPGANMIVTNPPFSKKYKFLARCYELGKPFALLMPVEVLGAVTAQRLFQEYGFQVMFLNKRVDFKMPHKGWDGAGSWFPTAWFCWQLLPEQIMFGEINK